MLNGYYLLHYSSKIRVKVNEKELFPYIFRSSNYFVKNISRNKRLEEIWCLGNRKESHFAKYYRYEMMQCLWENHKFSRIFRSGTIYVRFKNLRDWIRSIDRRLRRLDSRPDRCTRVNGRRSFASQRLFYPANVRTDASDNSRQSISTIVK